MAETHAYSRLHDFTGPLLRVDPEAKGAELLEAARDDPTGRSAETLAKQGHLRIVVIAFTAGAFMHDHAVAGPSYLQLLRGQINIRTAEDSFTLSGREAMMLGPDVRHSVVALSDSVLLLVLALEGFAPVR